MRPSFRRRAPRSRNPGSDREPPTSPRFHNHQLSVIRFCRSATFFPLVHPLVLLFLCSATFVFHRVSHSDHQDQPSTRDRISSLVSSRLGSSFASKLSSFSHEDNLFSCQKNCQCPCTAYTHVCAYNSTFIM